MNLMLVEFIMYLELGSSAQFVGYGSEEEKKYIELTTAFENSVASFIDNITKLHNPTEEEIQYWAYECAKPFYGEEKTNLRQWFYHLYQLMFSKDSGTRWGTFIKSYGVNEFVETLYSRLNDPWRIYE